MGFTIEELRREPSGAMYVSPERLCVTADGQVCSEDDPRAVSLLVGKGCEIPASQARQYGLIIDEGAETGLVEESAPDASEEETAEQPKRKK